MTMELEPEPENCHVKLIRSIALGKRIDCEFALLCVRLGLDYKTAITAPLDYIALALTPKGRIH